MKNFTINVIALGIISIISVSQLAYGAELPAEDTEKAVVNGVELKNNIYETDNNVKMYPVREVSELLGYTVEWNGEDRSCTITDENSSLSFVIGEDKYSFGSGSSSFGTAPELKDGVTYVPSEFLKGFLDLNITDENSETINITSEPEITLEADKTITVNAGDLFAVRLEENASTGYTWTVEKDENIKLLDSYSTTVTQTGSDTNLSESSVAVGTPSMKTWVYKCDVPGEYTLKYTYSRSFEENGETKTAEFKVVVADNSSSAEVKEVTVNSGENFTISLEENTSTGYAWTVEKDDKIELVETADTQEENTDGKVGVPSTKTWTFKCDEVGEYNIKFTYERSFEPGNPAQIIEYKVIVK